MSRYPVLFTLFISFILAGCSSTKDVTKSTTTSGAENKSDISPKPSAEKSEEGILTLEDIFSGKFRMENFAGVQWRKNGTHFTQVNRTPAGNEIIEFDARTGISKTLFSVNQLTPPGAKSPLSVDGYSWSEDDSKLLIFTNSKRVWRDNTKGDYWVLDIPTNKLSQIGRSLPPSSLMFAKFDPGAELVAYVSEHNLFIEELLTRTITKLTQDGNENIINGTFDWAYEEELFCKDGFRWSPNGKWISFWQIDATDIGDYFMINTTDSIYPFTIPVEYPKAGTDPSSAKIGLIDISTKKLKWLEIPGDSKQNYLPRMQWIDNSTLIVQQLNRKQNKLTLWKCNVTNGAVEYMYTESDPAWVDIVHMDVSAPWEMLDLPQLNNSLYRLTDKNGFRHLYKIPLDGSKEVLVTNWKHDIACTYALDGENGTGYVCASPNNSTQRYLYAIQTNASEVPQLVTPEKYSGVNAYDVAPGGKFAVHRHSSATTPPSVHLISLPDHKIVKTFADNEAYIAQLKSVKMPKAEFFTVTTDEGIKMDGRIFKPWNFDKNKKYPVICNLYGEPAGQTAVDQWSSFLWPALMTQKGFLYITMDNRGTPCLKGREWRKSIYRKVGLLNVKDQANAAKKVANWSYVDGENMSVWGWSGGGSMTLNLMFQYPGVYKTGVSIAAVANQLYYDNIYQERYMGLPSENMEDFVAGSPITYAKNLEGNLLYIHGTADDNVHYQNAEALINELVKYNKQFDLMSYPGRSHGIWEGEGTTKHLYTMLTNYFLEH